LKGYLSSESLLDYHQKNKPYNLITSCHTDQILFLGVLNAILTQTNEKGSHGILTYASRKLQKHEKN
jgi:hypothetical protein